jgi:hypothetical protein
LAELFLTVGIFYIVGLIDDIDEMLRFGNPPKNLANAGSQLPVVLDMYPGEFTDVEMRSIIVLCIPANIRNKRENIIAVIPGFVVFTLDADGAVKFFQLINTGMVEKP